MPTFTGGTDFHEKLAERERFCNLSRPYGAINAKDPYEGRTRTFRRLPEKGGTQRGTKNLKMREIQQCMDYIATRGFRRVRQLYQ